MGMSGASLDGFFEAKPVEPLREMAAYESLWLSKDASFKRIAELFSSNPGRLPSELASDLDISSALDRLKAQVDQVSLGRLGLSLFGTMDYPERLRDAAHPLELFYYQGNADLAYSEKSVAIVGSRKPSPEGIRRARKLSSLLVREGVVIFSGLAEGIDTAAHTAALKYGGATVGVIGTPITEAYPKANAALQKYIAQEHLVVSQVPILRYAAQDYRQNRFFFPERNATMSALSDATVIVEASETSGTLTQARAALRQGRKLFILDNCFRNPAITWPARFQKQGAVRVSEFEQVMEALAE